MVDFVLGEPVLMVIIMVGAGWAVADAAARRRLMTPRTNRLRRRMRD